MLAGWQNSEIDGLVDGTTRHELLRSFIGVKRLCIWDSLLEELSLALEADEIESDPGFLPGLQELVFDMRPPAPKTMVSSFIRARRVTGLPGHLGLPSPISFSLVTWLIGLTT